MFPLYGINVHMYVHTQLHTLLHWVLVQAATHVNTCTYILTSPCVHRKSQYAVHCKQTPCACGPCVWTWRHGSRQLCWQPTLTTVLAVNSLLFHKKSDEIYSQVASMCCVVLCCGMVCMWCVCACLGFCLSVCVCLSVCLYVRMSVWVYLSPLPTCRSQITRVSYKGKKFMLTVVKDEVRGQCINACPSHWVIHWMLSTCQLIGCLFGAAITSGAFLVVHPNMGMCPFRQPIRNDCTVYLYGLVV